MPHVRYVVTPHDHGFAYRVGDTFSETYLTREEAHAAAERAAGEQRGNGETTEIEYETADGEWRRESARGDDRPETDVED